MSVAERGARVRARARV